MNENSALIVRLYFFSGQNYQKLVKLRRMKCFLFVERRIQTNSHFVQRKHQVKAVVRQSTVKFKLTIISDWILHDATATKNEEKISLYNRMAFFIEICHC